MKINLRELRTKNGLSERELERISEVNHSTISRIETGDMMPSIEIVCKLCIALDVTLEEMIDYKEE